MELSERDLEVFIHSGEKFFTVTTGDPVETGEARIHFNLPPLQDYTGWIQVDGIAQGVVCVTASRRALGGMLSALGEPSEDDELMADLVGELAGTIVMNAREHFGQHLSVSTPRVIANIGQTQATPQISERMAFVIPIRWHGNELLIVIAIELAQNTQH